MRLGLVARADNSGLGVQTLEFYRHMHPDKTMVVDISDLNGNKVYQDRYPTKAVFISGFPNSGDIRDFLQDLDVVFIAESAYNNAFYLLARQAGVKIAVQYNYEFFDWFSAPEELLPDMFIAPSRWHYEDVDRWCVERNIKHVYLHCPINRQLLPFREKSKASTFLHIAGRSAAHDRNGTKTVIEASAYLKSDAQILIHFQGEQGLAHQATSTIADYTRCLNFAGNPNKVKIQVQDIENYHDIYATGDVLLLPRRYGGNCLPLNEALSTGMPVIMTDISPNNHLLPPEWLLPAVLQKQFAPRTIIDIYGADPFALAQKIDWFYELNGAEMLDESNVANAIASQISWETMEPLYRQALEGLCTQP